ncbi:MAG: tetratricopeptide repeat protein [Candidatus Obscuribacterales bacterium]|nr:tetratricopeptide repeat protein [Candidatus Obscuribacterales bacterium]
MKKVVFVVAAILSFSPCALADEAVSPDSVTWRENYVMGRKALSSKNYSDAETFFEKAYAVAQNFKPGDSRSFAIMSELLTLDNKRNDNTKYEAHMKQQLAAYIKAFGSTYYQVGMGDEAMAMLYDKLGRFAEAEKYYREAIPILEQGIGGENPRVAETCHRFGRFLWETGRPAEALKLIQKEESILQKVTPPLDSQIAGNYLMQGYIFESLAMPKEAQIAWSKYFALKIKNKSASRQEEYSDETN